MKQTLSHFLRIALVLSALTLFASISGCGQKGPLIVEQTDTEQVTTQEEELEETK